METKIIKLITGEEVICKVSHSYDTDNNIIGFKFHFPYKIIVIPNADENGQTKFDVNYLAWMGASADTEFDVSFSSVVSIGSPLPEVEDLYMERYSEYLNDLKEKE
jgi:hypothetical protein